MKRWTYKGCETICRTLEGELFQLPSSCHPLDLNIIKVNIFVSCKQKQIKDRLPPTTIPNPPKFQVCTHFLRQMNTLAYNEAGVCVCVCASLSALGCESQLEGKSKCVHLTPCAVAAKRAPFERSILSKRRD